MPSCRAEIIDELRRWIVQEEIRRVGHRHYEAFDATQGYLLALSNLMEFLQQLDRQSILVDYGDGKIADGGIGTGVPVVCGSNISGTG